MRRLVSIPASLPAARAKLREGLSEFASFCVRAIRLMAEVFGMICFLIWLASQV